MDIFLKQNLEHLPFYQGDLFQLQCELTMGQIGNCQEGAYSGGKEMHKY